MVARQVINKYICTKSFVKKPKNSKNENSLRTYMHACLICLEQSCTVVFVVAFQEFARVPEVGKNKVNNNHQKFTSTSLVWLQQTPSLPLSHIDSIFVLSANKCFQKIASLLSLSQYA